MKHIAFSDVICYCLSFCKINLQEFKRETRFTSKCPANEIIHKIEEAAKPLGFDVHKKNYKVRTCRIWNFRI